MCVDPVPLKDTAAPGRARLQELAPTEVRPEGGAQPGHAAGFGLILTPHAFLPTLSWSPALLEVTPAAPAPPHEGQLDLVGQLRGGGASVLRHHH